MTENFKEKLQKIRCFIFDCDGVLTNGQLLVMPDGELLRSMNIKDGYAMQLAIKKGYLISIISGGVAPGVQKRLEKLGIVENHMNAKDKMHNYEIVKIKHHVRDDEILIMGDDLPDFEMMKMCGVPTCPADAVHEIKDISFYTSPYKGGEGCARDVIEQVLRVHGKWE